VEPTPRLGPEPPRVHRSGHARGTAWLPLEDSPTYRIQYSRRKCALPQQSPRRLLPGCIVGRVLPRRTVQSLAPPMPHMSAYYASWTRRLGFAHCDAYTVASTDYAASYIAPTGASPMGQIKTPLGQRGYRAMKRIREEILNTVAPLKLSAQYIILPR